MAIRMSMDEYNQRLVAGQNDSAKHDALYNAHQRIAQLETLNATLAAQIDRMTLVVDAALHWYNGNQSWSTRLAGAMNTYQQQMAALAHGRVMANKFIYCPRCDRSDEIYQTDYEEENAEGEYEIDDDGRRCDHCNWEGDVSELVCKDDDD